MSRKTAKPSGKTTAKRPRAVGKRTPRFTGRSGAEVFHQMLIDEGVEVMFGYPGGVLLPIFDELYKSKIPFILTRHEQGAAHMADGYARSTGKVGFCMATSGPGATNLTTGLATANMDSSPIVAVTGQVRTSLIGNDAFQEADVTGLTRPITKHNFLVKRVEDLGRTLREAFYIARTGRPGPVVVDIPVDVTVSKLVAEPSLEPDLPGYRPRTTGHIQQIRAASEAINAAERPVLYVGGGVILAGASPVLRKLVAKGKLPVTTTLLALGAVDESDPLSLQMLGMHGTVTANYAVQKSDCLVAVGARFDDRVTGNLETFAPHAKIIHIDIDPSNISKNVVADIPVVGDAKDILERMLPLVKQVDRSAWLKQIARWKKQHPLTCSAKGKIKPQEIVRRIGEATKHEAIIATGVGQHQMWTAQFYGWRKPRQIITSGGLGTMGFGVPAAIGAKVGNPTSTVIDIDGDGSFSMTMVEIITAVQNDIAAKFVVLDNGYLGMVRQWQELFYGKRYSSVRHPCPDLRAVAKGFGAEAVTITERSQINDAVAEMLACDGPFVLDAKVEPEENVFPMVPAGKSLDDMEMGTLGTLA